MQLVIIQNDRQIKTPLEAGRTLVLGRHKDADILVNDGGISRRHLTLEVQGNKLHVRDLESRNGFQVDGSKQQDILMAHNDGFEIGNVEFIFQTVDDPSAFEIPSADDETPIDADFVPISKIEEHETQADRDAAIIPVKTSPGIVPISNTVTAKEEPSIEDKREKTNKLLKIAIPAIAIFFIVVIIAIAMSDGGEPINETANSPVVSNGGDDSGTSRVKLVEAKQSYKEVCEEAIDDFNIYFKDPSGQSNYIDKAIALTLQAEKMSDSLNHKAHEDIGQILSVFKNMGFKWENFSQAELRSIQRATSEIDEYPNAKTTPKIRTFSNQMVLWTSAQSKKLKEVEEIKKLYDKGNAESYLLALKKCGPLKLEDHIYIKKVIAFEKRITSDLAEEYFTQASNTNDASEKEDLFRKASRYNKKYKKDLDEHISKLNNREKVAALYKTLESHVEHEEHKEVVEKAPELYNTAHEAYAKRHFKNSSIFLLLRKMRSLYEQRQILKMSDTAVTSFYKDEPKVQNLLQRYKTIDSLLNKALHKLKIENYEGAKSDLLQLLKLEINDHNSYYVEAKKILDEQLSNDSVALKHLKKADQLFRNGSCPLDYYKTARNDYNIAEKYNPDIAKKQIRTMVERAETEYKRFISFAYKGTPTAVTLKPYFNTLCTCLEFLDEGSKNEEEIKIHNNIKREVDNWTEKLKLKRP